MEPLFLEKPVRSVNFEQAFLNPSLRKNLTGSREAHGEIKSARGQKDPM